MIRVIRIGSISLLQSGTAGAQPEGGGLGAAQRAAVEPPFRKCYGLFALHNISAWSLHSYIPPVDLCLRYALDHPVPLSLLAVTELGVVPQQGRELWVTPLHLRQGEGRVQTGTFGLWGYLLLLGR